MRIQPGADVSQILVIVDVDPGASGAVSPADEPVTASLASAGAVSLLTMPSLSESEADSPGAGDSESRGISESRCERLRSTARSSDCKPVSLV